MQALLQDRIASHHEGFWRHRQSLTPEDWDDYLPFFQELYNKENRTLEDAMRVMEEALGFYAT